MSCRRPSTRRCSLSPTRRFSNKDLTALIKWKPGPRGGASQYNDHEARRVAWATLKDAPTPEPEGEEAPLPYAEELTLLPPRHPLPRRPPPPPLPPPVAATPAIPPATAAARVEDPLAMAALDAQIAVLMAARARIVQEPSTGAAASSTKRAMEDAAKTGRSRCAKHVPGHTWYGV